MQKGEGQGEVGGAGQRQRASYQRLAGSKNARTVSADGDKAVSSEGSAERHL